MPVASSHSTDAIRFSQARSDLGAWPRSVWPHEALPFPRFGNKRPVKDKILRSTCARRCGDSPGSLKENGKRSTAEGHHPVATRLVRSSTTWNIISSGKHETDDTSWP